MNSRPFGPLDWAGSTPGVAELLEEIRQASITDAARLPQSWFARLRATGFGRIRIPAAEGGLGGDVLDLLDAIVAIAAADSNLAQSWRTHILATERHVKTAPGPLRDRWLSRIAAGAIIGGGWTEADSSGPGVFTTRLSTATGSPTLTGRKFYSTGSRYADWLEYSAVDDAGELVIAAVRADGAGVALIDDWTGFGQRATASGTTVLDGAPVDPDDIAPFGSQHLGTAGWQQLTLLAVLVGIGDAARAAAAQLIALLDRAHGAAPVLALEGYGRISALVASARASLQHTGVLSEEAHQAIVGGREDAESLAARAQNGAFQAQAVIVEQIVEAADRLMSLPAVIGDGEEAEELRRTLKLDRYWRNAQTIATHNPVLHRLRAIADRELYDLDRIADPTDREAAVAARIAQRDRPLTVIRIDPALSAHLVADREALDSVAAAFHGREPVLFQFDDRSPERPTVRFDASVAIATWLARFPTSWFAVVTDDPADAGHPYNLARRIASLEQLSAGRIAWVVNAAADEHLSEYIRVVQQLWRSWPRESIAADASAQHFAQTDAIRRIGAEGAYPVAGPLNVPSSPQHLPVVVGAPHGEDVHSHVDLALRDDIWALRHDDGSGLPLARVRRADGVAQLLRIAAELPASDERGTQTLRGRLRLPAPAIEELPTASDRFPHDSETEAS